jgi:hypothetical protein
MGWRVLDWSSGGFQCWNMRLPRITECYKSRLVSVLICIGVYFLLIILIFVRVSSTFVSLLFFYMCVADVKPSIMMHAQVFHYNFFFGGGGGG